jgi:hypothetical protein
MRPDICATPPISKVDINDRKIGQMLCYRSDCVIDRASNPTYAVALCL